MTGSCGNGKIIIWHCSQERALHYHMHVKNFSPSVFVEAPLHWKRPPSTKHQLSLQRQSLLHHSTAPSLHFSKEMPVCQTQLQDSVYSITVSRSDERTVVRLHKLTSYYALRGRAASSLISLHCTQKKSRQGCQMVWLGNNTPFVRKQFVLRELWSVSRCDA